MSTHAHTLLLIDDDLSMHRLVSELLKSRVKHLWLSENPHEGLRLALTYKPSLILATPARDAGHPRHSRHHDDG
jgi:CheY-like chemotaxis protein